jgi:uncharacterized protein YbbC (DUF1343 family)
MAGPAWAWNPHFDRLAGSGGIRSALELGTSVDEIVASWAESISNFIHRREKHLLY